MNAALQGDINRSIDLHAADVWKSYDDVTITVLQGVDCEVMAGQTVALSGASGCGKSTLLRLFAGFDVPDRSRVWVTGVPFNSEASSR